MSFEESYPESDGCPFPCADVPIIAPLWIDFDFESAGLLYYRVTQDPSTLKQVADMIAQENPGLCDYQPRLAVIVTWFEATPIFFPV